MEGYWVRYLINRNDEKGVKRIYNEFFKTKQEALDNILKKTNTKFSEQIKTVEGYFEWEWRRKNNFDMYWIKKGKANDYKKCERANWGEYDDFDSEDENLCSIKAKLMDVFQNNGN